MGTCKFKGDVTIKDSNGEVIEVLKNCILQDGAFYDANTGKILSSVHTGTGVYDSAYWDKNYWRDENGNPVGEFIYKAKPKEQAVIVIPSGGGPDPGPGPSPSYPPKPPFLIYNQPQPTFNSDLKKINKYSYYFGLDSFKAKNVTNGYNSCFISKSIYLDTIKKEDYIELEAKYNIDDTSSIEFYIIDGEVEIPILPLGDLDVKNEKIFFGLNTRFTVDETANILIKQNDKITNYTLYDILNPSNIDTSLNYNISYTPITSYKYHPNNSSIKIKVIIRNYVLQETAPYVSLLKIRKYGGDALWTSTI